MTTTNANSIDFDLNGRNGPSAQDLIRKAGFWSGDWERDTDSADGWALAVSGDSSNEIERCRTALEAVGLEVSLSRQDSGRWIYARVS